jgi:hypothetical protein
LAAPAFIGLILKLNSHADPDLLNFTGVELHKHFQTEPPRTTTRWWNITCGREGRRGSIVRRLFWQSSSLVVQNLSLVGSNSITTNMNPVMRTIFPTAARSEQ